MVFSGKRWHVAEEWEGEFRWVVSAFTPREVAVTTESQWQELCELGFPTHEACAKFGGIRAGSTRAPFRDFRSDRTS